MRLALFLVTALVLSGCFQVTSLITVHADGSATLRDQITLSGFGLMALAEAAEGGEPLFDEATMAARADSLGEGVRLLAFDEREDGYTAVYAIGDIRTFRYGSPGAGASDSPSGNANGIPLTFDFEEGDPAGLRVLVPKPPPAKPEAEVEETDAEAQAMALGMMRSFVGDARVTVSVEVEGDIVDTNATSVDGPRVTLYDVPFLAVIEAMAESESGMPSDPSNFPALLEQIGEVDGVQGPSPGTIRVRFR